jgi:hypothetical protein
MTIKYVKGRVNKMKKMKLTKAAALILAVSTVAAVTLTGCMANKANETNTSEDIAITADSAVENSESEKDLSTAEQTASATTGGIYSYSDMFTERDLTQTADLSDAVYYTVSDGEDIHITGEGVYVLSGTASDVTVYVEAGSEDKVQIVLDGVSITNTDFPCIYVKSGDKVFVTTSADSTLAVTGTFTADGDTNTDGVIFSRSDLVLNGTGTLTVTSTDNGVVSKDDLKVTGGTYNITAESKAFEANDSIRISDGVFNLTAGTDCLHAENEDDDTLGFIYISGGTFTMESGDDGIHGVSVVQIDGGTITVTAGEGIEGTYIQINDGTVNITSWDDGINAAQKSDSYRPTLEINGGEITVTVTTGDNRLRRCQR